MLHLAFKALSKLGAGASKTASNVAWTGKKMSRSMGVRKLAEKATHTYRNSNIYRGADVASRRADLVARRLGMTDMERETHVKRARRNAMAYRGTKLAGKGMLSIGKVLTGGNVIGRSLAAVGDMVTLQKPRWENSAGIPDEKKRERGAGLFGRRKGNGFSLASGGKSFGGSLFDSAKRILDVRLLASPGVEAITSAQGSTTKAVEESSDKISGAVSQTSSMLQGKDGKFKAGNPGGKSAEVKEAKLSGNKLSEIANNQKQKIVKDDSANKEEKEKLGIIADHTNPQNMKAAQDYQKMLLTAGNKLAEEQVDQMAKSIGILNLIARLLGYAPKEQSRRGKAILGGLALAGGAYAMDEGFKKARGLFESGKETAEGAIEATGEAVDNAKGKLEEKGFEQTLKEDIIPSIEEFGKTVWDMFKGIVPAVKEFINSIINFFKADSMKENIEEFKSFFKTLWETVSELAKSLWNLFSSLYKALKPVIGFIFNTLATVGKVLVKGINFLANVISSVANTIANVVDWLRNSFLGRMFGINDKRGSSKSYRKDVKDKQGEVTASSSSPSVDKAEALAKKNLDVQEKQLAEMQLSRKDLKLENEKNRQLMRAQALKENETSEKQIKKLEEGNQLSAGIERNTKKEIEETEEEKAFREILERAEAEAIRKFEEENPFTAPEKFDVTVHKDLQKAENDFFNTMADRDESLGNIKEVTESVMEAKNLAFSQTREAINRFITNHSFTDDKGRQLLKIDEKNLASLREATGLDIRSIEDLYKFGSINDKDYQKQVSLGFHGIKAENADFIGSGNIKVEDFIKRTSHLTKRDVERDKKISEEIIKRYGTQETLSAWDGEWLRLQGYSPEWLINEKQQRQQYALISSTNKEMEKAEEIARAEYEEKKIQAGKAGRRAAGDKIAQETFMIMTGFGLPEINETNVIEKSDPPQTLEAEKKASEIGLKIQKESRLSTEQVSTTIQNILSHKYQPTILGSRVEDARTRMVAEPSLTKSAETIELGADVMRQAEAIKTAKEREKTVSALGGIMINNGGNTTVINQTSGGNETQNHIPRGDEGIYLLSSIPMQIAASRTGAGLV